MIIKLIRISLLAVLFVGVSCNKASEFGSFLESGSKLPVSFLELDFDARTIPGDSVLSWDENFRYTSHVLGTLNDPVFGKSRAELFWQFNLAIPPDFTNADLDSMVLSIGYDTLRTGYGDFLTPQNLLVSRIGEQMFRDQVYYSNRTFEVLTPPIGFINDVVPNADTVFVKEPRNNTPTDIQYGPHLRIVLSETFGDDFIEFDPAIFDSNIAFQSEFFGVRLIPRQETGGMINFEVFGPETRLNVYFTANDTMGQYNMSLSPQSVIHSHFTHDVSGSVVEQFLQDDSANDSLLFVQAMGGPCVEITFSDLSPLQNSTINSALLEVTLTKEAAMDSVLYPPISQMALLELNEDGSEDRIIDLIDIPRGQTVSQVFGGNIGLDEDDGVFRYVMNMSQHLQRILDGEATNRMILTTLQPVSEPGRVVLYGTDHPQYAARMLVTYTQLLDN